MRRCLATLGAALLTLTACVDRSTDVPTGAELYATYCASCHGVDGRGDGPVAAALTATPSDLTRLTGSPGGFDETRLMSVIDGRREVAVHGTREMPVWGAVFSSDPAAAPLPGPHSILSTRALVDYLATLQEQ